MVVGFTNFTCMWNNTTQIFRDIRVPKVQLLHLGAVEHQVHVEVTATVTEANLELKLCLKFLVSVLVLMTPCGKRFCAKFYAKFYSRSITLFF